MKRVLNAFLEYHRWIGRSAAGLFGRVTRLLGRCTAAPRRAVHYIWLCRVVRPVRRFFKGVAWLFPQHRPPGVGYFANTKEQWKMLGRVFGPLAGVGVLVLTLLSWTGTDYYLDVNYRGVDIGVVENAEVYAQGAAMALDRVNNIDDSFTVDAVPVFTMTMQGHQAPLSAEEVCDAILRTAGDSIAESTGLYVDGKFVAAMESRKELEGLLESLKNGHYDKKDKSQKADFVQKVKLQDGLFPISTIKSKKELKKTLTAQKVVEKTYEVQQGDVLSTIAVKHSMTVSELRAMNPQIGNSDFINVGDKLTVQRPQAFLQVKVLKRVRYTETIDYKTKTVYRDDKPVTYTQVVTAGKEGSQTVVAEDTYVDGIKTGRKIVNRTLVKKAINKIVEKGTKPVQSPGGNTVQQGDGVTHGSMTWPVPICRRIYQGYHRGHLGIDISSGPVPVLGKPAVAADGGTVIQASNGWNGGYGNVVKIRHSNGLITVYAHLQTVKVVTGQYVSRGQTIGLIGNTGYSFGPHLHFEVIKNGVKVNPSNYVSPY